jgi:hypothetical protein
MQIALLFYRIISFLYVMHKNISNKKIIVLCAYVCVRVRARVYAGKMQQNELEEKL